MAATSVINRKPNILFIDIFSHFAGAELSWMLLLKYLDREKFNPICVIPESGPVYQRIKELNIKVKIIPLALINFPYFLSYLRTVWQLTKFIRQNRIDLVVCNNEMCNQFSLPAAYLNRIPVVCHLRALVHGIRYFLGTFLYLPDDIIANSYATEKCYSPYFLKRQNIVLSLNHLSRFAKMTNQSMKEGSFALNNVAVCSR